MDNEKVQYESNVDELLRGTSDKDSYPDDPIIDKKSDEEHKESHDEPSEETEEETTQENSSVDEYGNELLEATQESPKMYTQAELNERINEAIRDRLSRLKNNQQPNREAENESKPDDMSEADWQKELTKFIENTFDNISHKKQEQERQLKEQQALQEFETKFQQGMGKFKDFQEVVAHQPITDAMTLATRGMQDPAGFLYAASKRASDDLNRISQIRDPYAQMVEMGKLEVKLKTTKHTTNTPRPLGKVRDDVGKGYTGTTKQSVDDLIRESEMRRREQMDRR